VCIRFDVKHATNAAKHMTTYATGVDVPLKRSETCFMVRYCLYYGTALYNLTWDQYYFWS